MKQIETYKLEADGISADIEIQSSDTDVLSYNLKVPDLDKATRLLMHFLKRQLITDVKVSAAEILDPKVMGSLKEKFRVQADSIISNHVPTIKPNVKNFLIGKLLHEMLGFGDIEFLLNDKELEEIVINSASEPIRIYHKKYGWMITNIDLKNEDEIQNFSNMIARRVGRQITSLTPLLDAHLTTGDRVNSILYPISTKGHTITIRKFARDPWTVTDLIKNKTGDVRIFSLLWLAIQYEMNLIISGGTASGKTSFLNVCMPFIPPNQRVISMEDTRELQLPPFLYWCPLTTRQPNPEGKGEVSMLDLLVNSLRMRPDRIILGEMRRQKEAQVLFEAMHTGHSVCATVHADSMHETIRRLVNPPIEVPKNLLGSVNLNVVMFRDRRTGKRRTYQIGEFLVTEDENSTEVKPNILYRWKPSSDEVIEHSKSLRLWEDLSRHTGMTYSEIQDDIKEKSDILNYLVKNSIRQLEEVGKILNKYYLNKEELLKMVKRSK